MLGFFLFLFFLAHSQEDANVQKTSAVLVRLCNKFVSELVNIPVLQEEELRPLGN